MEIYEDDFGLFAKLFDYGWDNGEWILQRCHESTTLNIHHCDGWERAFLNDSEAAAGSRSRIIDRTHEAFFTHEQFHHFLLIPQMIAAGDGIHSRSKDFVSHLGRDAVAASGVFAIGDNEVQAVLRAQFGKNEFDGSASGFTHDVANEKNLHAAMLIVILADWHVIIACAAALALLKFTQMRPLFQWKLSSLKPALAGLLATIVFLMTIASASAGLHFKLHTDATHDHGTCAVCTIAKGQLDTPVAPVSEVFASLSVAWTIPSVQSVQPCAIDLSVAPSRGPPASVSSQS